ncbi:ribose transport system substrate-binding protein [Pseudomonas duriflava]|uniref:Ribose transport system substrate-binding protein n=1 Tax=Pseudomonas duriflava TaxID=459528 RepID=A0A562QMP5_9PSED|nr:substrate-binding domain-containing protein [Pseudomonas duriflava]TWI57470.1 ribose transport system substrate-binding protein [Pseudomonas duriflava]
MKSTLKMILAAGLFIGSLAQAATPLIGVGMAKYDDNFQVLLRNGVQSQASSHGADVFMEDGQDNGVLQLRQVRNFIASKVDAIIVTVVDMQTAPEMTRLANEAGIPLVFINRNPEPAQWTPNTAFVGSDEIESGTLQMEELARRANYKGKVVVLVGDPGNKASKIRTEDVENVVAKYPEMKIIQKKIAHWQRSEAAQYVMEWVKQGVEFDIIAANNDEMAIGAVMGLEKVGKNPKDYLIGGIDGTPDALALMGEGKLTVSVLQSAAGQASGAVDVAMRLIRREPVQALNWVPFKLITPENRYEFQ